MEDGLIFAHCMGFEFDLKQNICTCHHLLLKQGVQCNVTMYTINRKAQQWIGAYLAYGIVVHHHCPFDHCKPHDLSLNLSTPDDQYAFNRFGTVGNLYLVEWNGEWNDHAHKARDEQYS